MKKIFSLLAVVLLLSVVTACGSTSKKDDKIVIGANIYNFGDNFMNGVVSPALKEFAAQKGVEIEIVDSENQQSKLNDQVDMLISKGVDVLAINLCDPAAARTIIEKAKAADIPLVLFNKEATEKGVMDIYDKVWYVGTNSAESGIIQGQMIANDWKANTAWDKNGDGVMQYVMLKGEPGHPDAEARTVESVKAIQAAGIQTQELAILADPNWSTQFGKDTTTAWLSSTFGPQIELIIANNDGMAFGAITAMKEAGVQLPIYGVDALTQALDHIERGEMNGTVLNDGKNQAKAVIDLAVNAAQGKDVLEGTSWKLDTNGSKAVRVAYVGVTKDNYKDFR